MSKFFRAAWIAAKFHISPSVSAAKFCSSKFTVGATVNFPLRNFVNFQQLQALIFAVEEINNNPNILPNITLGFQAYDSWKPHHMKWRPFFQSHVIYKFRVVSPNISVVFQQVSHFSTSPVLSDKRMFPSFFRTVPSDMFQSQGLAKLVLHFGWTWIGLLALDNDYGQQGIQLVKQELIKAGACIAFSENILMSQPDRNARHIVNVIKKSAATVIIVFSLPVDLVPILDEMLTQNITKKVFVASEAWSTSTLFSDGKFSDILTGTIGLALHSEMIPGFGDFLNKSLHSMTWLKLLWEEFFVCKFAGERNLTVTLDAPIKMCTGMEALQINDVSSLRATYNVYTAVRVVAKAFENMKNIEAPKVFSCGKCEYFKPWKLLEYMRKVKVVLSSGREIFFDENGDPPAVYDIVNWKLSPEGTIKQGIFYTLQYLELLNQASQVIDNNVFQVPVSVCSQSCPPGFRKVAINGKPACCFQCIPCPQGEISNHTDAVDCVTCTWDEWPNLQKTKCLQKNIEYLSYEDPLGASLAVTGIISSLVPVVILRLFIKYKSTPIVKANNYSLSCLLLLCLPLCFLCSLTFIGYPQPEKCLLRQAAFGLVFTLCISCILAKTIMVVFAFMAHQPGSKLRILVRPFVSYLIISICFLLQLILCLVSLVKLPSFTEYDTQTKPGIIIVQCNNGFSLAFWSMLAYLGLLATISFIVAFLARRLPDSFNEAKFITFSMLAFLSVWVSFILASLNAQGKYTEAVEVFAILSSSWALVACMFLPKCFIMLFRPALNSKKRLIKDNSHL
uniref:G-protein coupled receptors family 3 profile domain-containing protein n=1 Tax=Xenopus tropicalis TaxID=8364 RepID=A0A6I8QL48_XENTR